MTGLPPGMAVCPGWTADYGPNKGKSQLCGDANLFGRKANPAIVRAGSGPCTRCHKQKASFDDEQGRRDEELRKERERYSGLIDRYVEDLAPIGLNVNDTASAVRAVDALETRDGWPPHARRGEPGWRQWTFSDKTPKDAVKLDVLRRIAGQPVKHQ